MKNINNNTFASTSKFSYTESKITKANVSSHILMLDMFFHFISFITKYSNGIQSFYLDLFFFFVYLDFLLLSFAFVCQLGSLRIGQTDRKRGNEEKRERGRERESEKEKLMLVVLCRVCYIHKKHVRCQFHCLVGASHNSRALSEKKMLLNSISI